MGYVEIIKSVPNVEENIPRLFALANDPEFIKTDRLAHMTPEENEYVTREMATLWTAEQINAATEQQIVDLSIWLLDHRPEPEALRAEQIRKMHEARARIRQVDANRRKLLRVVLWFLACFLAGWIFAGSPRLMEVAACIAGAQWLWHWVVKPDWNKGKDRWDGQ